MIGKYTRTLQVRAERRERAIAVQEANKRTPQEQLAHLDKMGMVAAKERAKIAKKLKKGRGAMPPPEFAHEMGMTAEQVIASRKAKKND